MKEKLPPIDLASARTLIRLQSEKVRSDGFIYRFVRAAWLILEALESAEARLATIEAGSTRTPAQPNARVREDVKD